MPSLRSLPAPPLVLPGPVLRVGAGRESGRAEEVHLDHQAAGQGREGQGGTGLPPGRRYGWKKNFFSTLAGIPLYVFCAPSPSPPFLAAKPEKEQEVHAFMHPKYPEFSALWKERRRKISCLRGRVTNGPGSLLPVAAKARLHIFFLPRDIDRRKENTCEVLFCLCSIVLCQVVASPFFSSFPVSILGDLMVEYDDDSPSSLRAGGGDGEEETAK